MVTQMRPSQHIPRSPTSRPSAFPVRTLAAKMLDAQFVSDSFENAKLLAERPEKRKADLLIALAGGVIDLDNQKLLRALHAKRDNHDGMHDGWLEWEKKHAVTIGLSLDEEEPVDNEEPMAKMMKASSPTSASPGLLTSPPP